MEDDAPPGVPEWVVTYGDMMSLLLTFFIMLVSLSEIVADQKYRAVMDALQQYVGYRATPKSPPGKNFPLNSMIERLTKLGSHHKKREGFGGVRHESPPGTDVTVFNTTQGNSLRVGEPVPFDRTEITLSAEAVASLKRISDELAGKPNKIEIAGHASPKPMPPNTPTRDKLLLSYLRARATMQFLVARGVEPKRIRLRAAGDAEPLVESGDKRSRQHDRVEVHLLDKFADHFVGPTDASP